jgi:molecular chaperone GrpE
MSQKNKKNNEQEEPKPNGSAEAGAQDLEPLREDLEKLQQELGKLGQELENAKKEKEEVFDRLQRVYADYANFQKRVPKNIADTVAYERERFIRSFLPILDNFDRTLREARAVQNLEAVIQGVEIIRDQMLTILKSHGVEPIQSLKEKFDPQRHEALLRKSEPDQEDDVVVEEFQKGYLLNDRVLRPSRVAVNKVPAPTAARAGGVEASQTPTTEPETSPPGTEAAPASSEQENSTE